MSAAELEDYLEVQNPKVRKIIAESHREFVAGKSRPAEQLLGELKRMKPKKVSGSSMR